DEVFQAGGVRARIVPGHGSTLAYRQARLYEPRLISLLFQVADLLAEAGDDAALGHVDRSGRQAELAARVAGAEAVHGGQPEGPPRRLLELAADALGRPGEGAALVLLVPELAGA